MVPAQWTAVFFVIALLSKPNGLHHKYIRQADAADYYPKKYTLYKRTETYRLKGLFGKRRSDEEQRQSDELLGELVYCIANERAYRSCRVADKRGVAQYVGIENDGYYKPYNERRNILIPRLRSFLSVL